MTQQVDELAALIEADVALIFIETYEEKRALELLTQLAVKSYKSMYCWSPSDGLVKGSLDFPQKQPQLLEPEAMLDHLRFINEPSIFALCDLTSYLNDAKNVRYLKDLALNHSHQKATVVMIAAQITIPKGLQRYSASFSMALPDEKTLKDMVLAEAERGRAIIVDYG